ncbi:MAG: tRNA pseudouridine(55) synthase TruB [Gammaproteobacteria bacterium]|nr:tRNA pseudouridine(55) synthase TruB [Gammaproteobacteria bacterium]
MARRRERGRIVNGLLLLDKPAGITSNRALQSVKRLFDARKAGHTGSLDPLATGLLIICLGEATKISAYLLDADKRYRTTCRLGIKTSTADADGEIIQRRPVAEYSHAQIERVLQRFRGRIEQIPPMYSALKRAGKRLYTLARDGIDVPREPRSLMVHTLDLAGRDDDALTLDIHCSKGTYVRTLVEDIGEALGCGAHVTVLRRVGVAPYDAPEMIDMQSLEALAARGMAVVDARLLPIDTALAAWPALNVDEVSAHYLKTGQPVRIAGAPAHGKTRLYDRRQGFIGLGRVLDDGRIAPERTIGAV